MPRSKGRTGRPYLRLRDTLRKSPGGRVCWICGEEIDMAAPPRTPRSWSLDHVVPLDKGGAETDPANARAAHYGCNSSRGSRMATRSKTTTSRRW
ncbi:HNH endonuclease [Nonomuraea sp. NPDC050328]|uniref:HNH endonuclease n=1 Tax=Nonomuraea sp. NPDC050328 TaxID=3364361 RepID=UPI0037AA56A5